MELYTGSLTNGVIIKLRTEWAYKRGRGLYTRGLIYGAFRYVNLLKQTSGISLRGGRRNKMLPILIIQNKTFAMKVENSD